MSFLLAVIVFLIGCHRSSGNEGPSEKLPGTPQDDSDLDAPLAEIGDLVITVRDLQERIDRTSPYVRARYNSPAKKREFLEGLVQFEILAEEAALRGFAQHPDVVRATKSMMIQKLMESEFLSRVKPEDVSEEEMRDFYRGRENEFHQPEEIRVAAIILGDRNQAERVADKALGALGETRQGFRRLVSKYSIDVETRARGGDLLYFSRESKAIPRTVIDAAFELTNTGEVAGPVDAGDGRYYIIKRTGRRRAVDKSFEEVELQIRNRLYQQKRRQAQEEFLSSLREKAKIEIYEKNLEKVSVEDRGVGKDRD